MSKRKNTKLGTLLCVAGTTLMLASPTITKAETPTVNVQGNQIIGVGTHGIWSTPYGLPGANYVGSTNQYLGKEIEFTQKIDLNGVTWYKISLNGKTLGWVDSRAFSRLTNIEKVDANAYMGYKATDFHGVWSAPYGVDGANYLCPTDKYAYKDIKLVEKANYGNTTWYKFSVDGKVVGWVDKVALDKDNVKPADFNVVIGYTQGNDIWSAPWGTNYAEYGGSTNNYAYQTVHVSKTLKVDKVNWYYVSKDGKNIGWIDGGRSLSDLNNLKDENFSQVVGNARGSDGIWSAPYGEQGAFWIDSASKYNYQKVQIVQSGFKNGIKWYKIKQGNTVLGWVDAKIITNMNILDENKTVMIGDVNGHDVWSLPYGQDGARYVNPVSAYMNKPIHVTRSLVIGSTKWYNIEVDSRELGWIDSKAVSNATNIRTMNETFHVSNPGGHGVLTRPWGMQNASYIQPASNLTNKNLNIRIAVDYNGVSWYGFENNGQMNWIDSRAASKGVVQQNGLSGLVASSQTAQRTNQIVTVIASGTTAKVTFLQKENGLWNEKLSANGFVGSQGVGQASESTSRTPKGSYSLGFAFGTSNPGTNLPFRQITPNSYWISNVNDDQYNTWQERGSSSRSDEHLIDYPVQYKYGIVINYNTENIQKGAGSGFFLHVSNGKPTAGCVAIPENQMYELMKQIKQGAYIINVNNEQEIKNY